VPLDILVPYWGDPRLLQETVRSVLAQDSPEWLLTVVDDAYPDRAVQEWMATIDDPRVRYVRKARNEGITATFRTCAELATQERVVLPGCDDVLLPGYVRTILADHRAHPDVAVIQPGVRVVDAQGAPVTPLADRVKTLLRPRATGRVLQGEALATSLLHGDWMYFPSLAFRRETLLATPFQPGRAVIQDLALVIDMVAAGEGLLVDDEVCFLYRRHASASAPGAARFDGEVAYFRHAAAQMRALGWRRAERAARWRVTSRLHALATLAAPGSADRRALWRLAVSRG
jgi:glycosyltransferase involved in cell wall biosynthesis